MSRGLIAAVLLLPLAGCASHETPIDPQVKSRVAVFAQDKNCHALQAEFDRAEDSGVMEYVDRAMRDTGCY